MNLPADESRDQFSALCQQIGMALVTWQEVENAHFRIFHRLLGEPQFSIASIVYHHTESFEARHKMVGLLIQHSLKDKEPALRKMWSNEKGGLQKDVRDANLNRNKLAHYSHDQAVSSVEKTDDGEVVVKFSEPRLQPSPYNEVSRLLGRTPDRDEHNLSVVGIQNYIADFVTLTRRLDEFWERLPHRLSGPSLEQLRKLARKGPSAE